MVVVRAPNISRMMSTVVNVIVLGSLLLATPTSVSTTKFSDGSAGDDLLELLNLDLPGVDPHSHIEVRGNSSLLDPQGTQPPPPRIPFSMALLNASYLSKDDFMSRGMEHLYLITNLFLQAVHRDQEMPPELTSLILRELEDPTLDHEQGMRILRDLEENWNVLVLHYIGLTSLVVLGVLLAIVIPIAGFVFACCRCGGRCGGRYPSYDKKRDPCKRAILGTLLTTFIVIVLFGLVCSFVSNARTESGIQNVTTKMEVAVRDTNLYLNNTHQEVSTLCETNFKQLQRVLFNKLDTSGELINGQLARVSKAIAIANLTAIAASLSDIKKDLHIIRNTTVELQEETSYLQSGLRDVAVRLRDLKQSCEHIPQCLDLITRYAHKLEINNQFYKYLESDVLPQLPSVKSKLREVSRLIENDIEIEVKRGKRAFDSIAREIQSKVQTSIPEIKEQIRDTGMALKKVARDIGKLFQQLDMERADEYIVMTKHYIAEYSMYRYWYFFGVCCLLLLITFCFTLGVIFGCCGRRPDEATSCYKTTGASWLMWGVGLTFLFAIVIMLSTVALFLIGSVLEVFVCDPLRDPSNSDVFGIVSKQVHVADFLPGVEAPELTEVVRKCHNNESLYAVLDIHSYDAVVENLTNYRDFLKLDEKIDKIKADIGESIDTNVQILSKEARQQLKALANSSVARKDSWDYYTDILEQEVLTIDLLDLAALLNQTADELPPNYGAISVKLKNDAIFLEGLRRWLSSIKANTRTLKETTKRLSESLKFNKTSLNVAIEDLMKEAEFAQRYLRENGSAEIVELVSRFTVDFLADVDAYVVYVKRNMVEEVGRCGPLSNVYNSTTYALCKGILYPFNGYWASVGWVFLFFLPCMALAAKLASLYRRTEPYSGPLTDSEYLYDAYDERNSRAYLNHESMYDAYAERDNIPLTSGCDKKQQRRSRDFDCGRVAASYSTEPYAPPLVSPPRSDYPSQQNNDWGEYPSGGGPPRYTSQPSLSPEYERPPPYYYPGPGNP